MTVQVHDRVRVVGRPRRGGRRRARHRQLHVLHRAPEERLRQLVLRVEAPGDSLCVLAAAPTDLRRAFPRDVHRSEEVGGARRGRRRGRLISVFRTSTRNTFILVYTVISRYHTAISSLSRPFQTISNDMFTSRL